MAKVLVVESQADVCRSLGTALARSGHDMIAAQNALDALCFCREHHPEVVVVDSASLCAEDVAIVGDLRREFPEATCIAICTDPERSEISADTIGASYVCPDTPSSAEGVQRFIDQLEAA